MAAIALSVVSTAFVITQPRKDHSLIAPQPSPSPSAQQAEVIKYEVGRVIRSSNEPHEVTIIISLDSQNFVRERMIKLAHQLKEDFADAERLRVEILDDPNIANNYVPAGDMYRLFNRAKRGTYVLNRNTREEHIEFSTARGRAIGEIKIDLRNYGNTSDL